MNFTIVTLVYSVEMIPGFLVMHRHMRKEILATVYSE